MSKDSKQISRRRYPGEFQAEAVRLADAVGVAEAAKRLGLPHPTLDNWTKRRRKAAPPANSVGGPDGSAKRVAVGELEAEIVRLRRELANAKLDNEILRKAAAYFARESR
jgi:transposase